MHQPIYQLYKKFTEHSPGFIFGYAHKQLYYSLSVIDRRDSRARITQVGLLDSEDTVKRSWYALLKELAPDVVPNKTSE